MLNEDRARGLAEGCTRSNLDEVRLVEGPLITKTVRFNACSPAQVIRGMRSLGWEPEAENESGSIRTSEVELARPVSRPVG